MSELNERLDQNAIFNAVATLLAQSEYNVVSAANFLQDSTLTALFAEDQYGVVAIYQFEAWLDAIEHWKIAQAEFVTLLSKKLGAGDPKAWDAYLVILVKGELPDSAELESKKILYDTSRLRKLVIFCKDVAFLSDVKTALSPVLPFVIPDATARDDVLDTFADFVESKGEDRAAAEIVVEAYKQNDSIFDRLFDYVRTK